MGTKLVTNVSLNNFVYHLLYNCPADEKRKLSKKYLQAATSEAAAQRFIAKSTIEEKHEIMTQLGIQWFQVYFKPTNPKQKYVREVFEDIKNAQDNPNDVLKKVIEDRFFITGAKEFAHNMNLMAQLEDRRSYVHNMLVARAGFHLKNWKRNLSDPDTYQSEEDTKTFKYLAALSLNFYFAFHYVEAALGIAKNDLIVLLYLYPYRHEYLEIGELISDLKNGLSRNKVVYSVKRMFDGGYIVRSPDKRYSISATGILAAGKFIQDVLKATPIEL